MTRKINFISKSATHYNPILLLNGPPKIGKDTAFDLLDETFCCLRIAFGDPAIDIAFEMFGLQHSKLTVEMLEADKTTPYPELNGLTWRQVKINTLEGMKAIYGPSIWADVASNKVKMLDARIKKEYMGKVNFIICITDLGFPIEAETIQKNFPGRAVIARLRGYNKSFGKLPGYENSFGAGTGADSRNYIYNSDIPSVDLINSGTLDQYNHDLVQILKPHIPFDSCILDRNNKTWLNIKMSKTFKAHSPDLVDDVDFAVLTKVFIPKLVYEELPGLVEKKTTRPESIEVGLFQRDEGRPVYDVMIRLHEDEVMIQEACIARDDLVAPDKNKPWGLYLEGEEIFWFKTRKEAYTRAVSYIEDSRQKGMYDRELTPEPESGKLQTSVTQAG